MHPSQYQRAVLHTHSDRKKSGTFRGPHNNTPRGERGGLSLSTHPAASMHCQRRGHPNPRSGTALADRRSGFASKHRSINRIRTEARRNFLLCNCCQDSYPCCQAASGCRHYHSRAGRSSIDKTPLQEAMARDVKDKGIEDD